MRKFRFHLEPILSIRRHKTKEVETALARATDECRQLEHRINELHLQRAETFNSGEPSDLEFRVAQGAYLVRLEAALSEAAERLQEINAERERLQEAYRRVAREEQVLDRLRERRSDDHYRRERAQEFTEMNEIGINITSRRRNSRGAPPGV